MKGMPAYGKIEVGDRIKSVDGKTYDSADKMVSYISRQKLVHLSVLSLNETARISRRK